MAANPIDGQILLLTAAKASVPPVRLPDIVEVGQAHLWSNRERYRREYERVHRGDELEAFLVPDDHWDGLGTELDLDDRERSAVRRAHQEQFRRLGRRTDQEEAFETALEIRDAVLIAIE
ncbi:hypothetical protein EA462_10870 [Natrarchaeobius halalkaliphilus]|uniref:DUF8048 domain-containing protein n=1 Tax=Natrarchaeobius halalkaliphilus TaxID=1679091 RepID=A0A3N6M1C8_9EURY|nr:hypothetical protein [Natrarchaeobius halalkaliphilus]RQG88891.1 hypothetical protein EA462_10870 [Natrarchaeobius halalkaliphilus]